MSLFEGFGGFFFLFLLFGFLKGRKSNKVCQIWVLHFPAARNVTMEESGESLQIGKVSACVLDYQVKFRALLTTILAGLATHLRVTGINRFQLHHQKVVQKLVSLPLSLFLSIR